MIGNICVENLIDNYYPTRTQSHAKAKDIGDGEPLFPNIHVHEQQREG